MITFAAKQQLQRPALTLLNGELYVAYAGYADTDPYTGWVLGFNASTLQLNQGVRHAPDVAGSGDRDPGEEGGIWQSGMASLRTERTLYAMTGNGDFQPASATMATRSWSLRPTAARSQTQ